MKIIESCYRILDPATPFAAEKLVQKIADAARTCYQSVAKKDDPLGAKLVESCIKSGHTSVLEHGLITVRLVTDRGITHELVRHRHCAFSQESTRYCDYDGNKFDGELTVVRPSGIAVGTPEDDLWHYGCMDAEAAYKALRRAGVAAEVARAVLPTCLKSEIVISASPREWRSIFEMRSLGTTGRPHPDMQRLMAGLLKEMAELMPTLFADQAGRLEG